MPVPVAFPAHRLAQGVPDTEPLPKRLDRQNRAELARLDLLDVRRPLYPADRFLGIGLDADTAHPGDGMAQPNQRIAVEFIGAAEAVDDLGDRLFGVGVADIVGELEVFGGGAVFVFSFGASQVHNCLRLYRFNIGLSILKMPFRVPTAFSEKSPPYPRKPASIQHRLFEKPENVPFAHKRKSN